MNPLIGYGVYSKKGISSLTYIGEYAGELRARVSRRDKLNNYIFGYMLGYFGTPWVIDAEKKRQLHTIFKS